MSWLFMVRKGIIMKIDKNFGKKGMKYEVIKTILITELNASKEKYWLDLYREFEYDENTICSIYLFNPKEKKEVIYQITDKEINMDSYTYFINMGGKVVRIGIKDMPDDIYEIRNKIIEILK